MADTDHSAAPEESLAGPHYDLGGVVGRGSFGVILAAQDRRIRRGIVFKTPIAGAGASERGLRRFVQEARILARLEHPNIVPVHSLGVDGHGAPYYTMKHVQGVTLRDVFAGLREGNEDIRARFPLTKLLGVFEQVCDAVGFAHAQGILHRDLKPENVMLGEFGEVLVMDWGLAKLVGGGEVDDAGSPTFSPSGDAMKTADGTLVGTPAYMSPEQAQGRVGDLDERTDIYALGAILYHLLTLRPPVNAASSLEALTDAQEGRIPPALYFNSHREDARSGQWVSGSSRLPHCPGGRIPEALAAVAMKALSANPAERYQNVAELQADVAAYVNGFATGAEKAGLWRHLKLTIKRRKVEFAIVAAAFVAAHVVGGFFLWKLIQSERRAGAALEQAEAALEELQNAVPLLRGEALALMTAGRFAEALPKLNYLGLIVPDSAEFPALEGNALQSLFRFADAKAAYLRALDRDPDLAAAKENVALCDALLKAKGAAAAPPPASLRELHAAMQKQGRATEAAFLAPKLTAAQSAKFDTWRAKLKDAGLADKQLASLKMDADGLLELDLTETGLKNLSPLAGLPFRKLLLSKNPITDLGPLKGMPLTELVLDFLPVTDLKPLQGMRLTFLRIGATKITDLSPLRGMPLTVLNFGTTGVADLRPLQGMPLQTLSMDRTKVTDLSPMLGTPIMFLQAYSNAFTDLGALKGMPLVTLDLHSCPVTDLRPLAGNTQMRELTLDDTLVKDLAPLKGMPLEKLSLNRTGVTDLSPLKGTPLQDFSASRTGIKSLEPLRGAPLRGINVGVTGVSDLSPLRGMHLGRIAMDETKVTDLGPLRGMPLTWITMHGVPVKDLSPLRGMRLTGLGAHASPISDLSPLAGMPLANLRVSGNVASLAPLAGMPLKTLALDGAKNVADLSPLRGMQLEFLVLSSSKVADVSALRGMPLRTLFLNGTRVADVSPLAGIPTLEYLAIPPQAANIEALRRLPNLKRLSYSVPPDVKWDASHLPEAFWKQFNAPKTAPAPPAKKK